MIYSGRSQRSESSYIIGVDNFDVKLRSIFVFFLIIRDRNENDLDTIPMLTKSSNFSIINTAHIDLQNTTLNN